MRRFVDLEPGSLNSLKAYLGSGAIPGVGPKTAEYMVEGLGEHVLEILDGQFAVDALRRCKKIGKVLAEKIKDGWEASRGAPLMSAPTTCCLCSSSEDWKAELFR